MKKILVTLTCLLFLFSVPCFAVDYFLDLSHDQGGGGDGTTMETDGGADDAFKTFAEVIAANPAAGSAIWIRRITNVTQGADIAPNDDGTAPLPIYWIGWPRDADSWDCDWVNGSTTVDNIDENDAARSTHQGRWITGPDGYDYLITDITDANTIIIDRPYAGATAPNEVVAVKADELPQGISEPGDTDGWSADGDALALVDFNDGDFQFKLSGDVYQQLWNIEFKDSTDVDGVFYTTAASSGAIVNGCLFSQSTQNDPVAVFNNGSIHINRSIFEGFGGVNSNVEVVIKQSHASIKNSAIYNMGDHGIDMSVTPPSFVYLENVNIGVEVANSDDDIRILRNVVIGRDVKMGSPAGEVLALESDKYTMFVSVNHDKVLGAWKMFYVRDGTVEKAAVSGEVPDKKLSDNVIKITLDTASTYNYAEIEQMVKVWESRKTYNAGTYNVKVWIFNDTGNTLNDTLFSDDILMRCRAEAGSYGDATTEYVSMPWTYSDEIDILDNGGASDWDFLQADSVVVDKSSSKIYCEILISTSDAEADNIFIDPETSNP